MVKMKFKEPRPVVVEIDVTFPVYARSDYDPDSGHCSVRYRRLDADGMLYTIEVGHCLDEGEFRIEIEPNHGIDERCLDYCLGRGEHASSAEEFAEAYATAMAALARLKP